MDLRVTKAIPAQEERTVFRPVTRLLAASLILALLLGVSPTSVVLAAAPRNDGFDAAATIPALPFSGSVDNTDATIEPGEPFVCVGQGQTVWWTFTAPTDAVLRVDTAGSNRSDVNVLVFQASGPTISGLSFVTCAVLSGSTSFTAQAGATYYFQVGTVFGGPGTVSLNVSEVPPPTNDDFASAAVVGALPYSMTVDATAATLEPGEPMPPCGGGSQTTWFSFTPAVSATYVARSAGAFSSRLGVYTGSTLDALELVTCHDSPQNLAFQAAAGTTYFLQTLSGGSVTLQVEIAPPPVASFSAPSDISVFETADFQDFSSDPAGLGIATRAWDFGDGTTAGNTCCTNHRYATDGDYVVTLVVTTPDGRTASATRPVSVRTHDIAVTKFSVPTSAASGQTRQLTVGLKNTRYPETVNVALYRSLPGFFGWEQVGSTTIAVPILAGGRTTPVSFSYTFTNADAAVGKVSFKAIATIIGARDPLPADNEAISTPTKVTR
jgi:PKD repeat protein